MPYSNFEPIGADGTSKLHTIERHPGAQDRALVQLKERGLEVDLDTNKIAARATPRLRFRGLGYAARAIIIIYVGLDAIIFPMFRPSSRWLGGRAFIHAAQRRVGRLPAYVILALLALPFAIAEPAKVLAVYLMATGHAFIGTLVLAGAYFISLVIVERLFRGGRTKLLTIPWFKNAWRWLMGVRKELLKQGRSTRLWTSFVSNRDRFRRHAHVARLRRRSGLRGARRGGKSQEAL